MRDILKTVWSNLEKWQKVTAVILLQGIVIVVFVSTINAFTGERIHIEPIDETGQSSDMPDEVKQKYEKELWSVISSSIDGLDSSIIKDAVIRENSYTEDYDKQNGVVSVRFIVDIESIGQSYVVHTGWTTDHSTFTDPIIDCPTQDEIIYKDNISRCSGTYRDASSAELYLPYEKTTSPDEEAKNILIEMDEERNAIIIQIVACGDTEQLKKEAMDYLNSTPINLSEYTIEYDISSLDANCQEGSY